MPEPLSGLQVAGVRYRKSALAQGDERSLDAYAASGVYQAARVPRIETMVEQS